MTRYEQDVNQIIKSVYDDAKAFSLRDKDDGGDQIDDLGTVKRFKLGCRAAENLLLSEEVLSCLDLTWDELMHRIDAWISSSASHPHFGMMLAFKNGGYDRKNFDLKEIRNDLMHIIGKPLAWEIAIGKTIGKLISDGKNADSNSNSIFEYLGTKFISAIFNIGN